MFAVEGFFQRRPWVAHHAVALGPRVYAAVDGVALGVVAEKAGDREHAAGVGVGSEGLSARLQVAAADREQAVGSAEAKRICGDGPTRVLYGQRGYRPIAVAAIERVEIGIGQRGVSDVIQHYVVANTGPGDAVAAKVRDGGGGVGAHGDNR